MSVSVVKIINIVLGAPACLISNTASYMFTALQLIHSTTNIIYPGLNYNHGDTNYVGKCKCND